jgi:hypothetical protein
MGYQNLTHFTRWLSILLITYLAGVIIALIMHAMIYRQTTRVARGVTIDFAQIDAVYRWLAITIGTSTVLLVVITIVFSVWVVRANRNAWNLGASMRIRPGWAVGYFFIPIFNLFKPYQAMKDLYLAAHDSDATTGLVDLWWSCFWGSWILIRIVARVDARAETPADFQGSLVLSLIHDASIILLIVSTLVMVNRIAAGLAAWHSEELAAQRAEQGTQIEEQSQDLDVAKRFAWTGQRPIAAIVVVAILLVPAILIVRTLVQRNSGDTVVVVLVPKDLQRVSRNTSAAARVVADRMDEFYGRNRAEVLFDCDQIVVLIPNEGEQVTQRVISLVARRGELAFRSVKPHAQDRSTNLLSLGDLEPASFDGSIIRTVNTDFGPGRVEPLLLFYIEIGHRPAFSRFTSQHVGRRLAIVVDDAVLVAPTLQAPIEFSGSIGGFSSMEEAADLAICFDLAPCRSPW